MGLIRQCSPTPQDTEGFQVSIFREQLDECKRSIQQRINLGLPEDVSRPMFCASNIHYEMADRTRAIGYGGIGLVHQLARQSGLIDALDRHVHVLKVHLPYHESDHVLNIAYNAVCEGRCLQDIELRRNDETFLDALQTERIPDPTTAGDFCLRFDAYQIGRLQEAIDQARLRVWARQPATFFELATIEMDVGQLGMATASGEEILETARARDALALAGISDSPSHWVAPAECPGPPRR